MIKNNLRIAHVAPREQSNGLGAVMCYDPYFARMVQSVCRCLSDGHPVMVRLHGAAQYPTDLGRMYRNDMEGQAVLIVGYNADDATFTIFDPWDNRWGGTKGGLRHVGFNDMSMTIVDSTSDCYLIAAPLKIDARLVSGVDGDALEVDAGFYDADGIVMDRDSLALREVTATVALPGGDGGTVNVVGTWMTGEVATLRFALASSLTADASVQVTIRAVVAGERPYAFRDTIEATVRRTVSAARVSIAANA